MTRVALQIASLETTPLIAGTVAKSPDASTPVSVFTDAARTVLATIYADATSGSTLVQPLMPNQVGALAGYVTANATYYWTAGSLRGQMEAVQAIPGMAQVTVNAAGGISIAAVSDQLAGAAGLSVPGQILQTAATSFAVIGGAANAQYTQYTVTNAAANASGSVRTHQIDVHLQGSQDMGTLSALYANSYNEQSGGSVGHHFGVIARAFNQAAGNTDVTAGLYAEFENNGPGTITLGASVYAINPTITAGTVTDATSIWAGGYSGGAGTVPHAYGAIIEHPTGGGSSNISLLIGNHGANYTTNTLLYVNDVLTGRNLTGAILSPFIFSNASSSTSISASVGGGFNVAAGLTNQNLVLHTVFPTTVWPLGSPVSLIAGYRANLGGLNLTGTSATATNVAAIYIDPITLVAGTATNKYGILQQGTDPNQLGGALTVTGQVTANGGLVVVGTANLSSGLTATTGSFSGALRANGGFGVNTAAVHLMDLAGTVAGAGNLTAISLQPALNQQSAGNTSVGHQIQPVFTVDALATGNNLVLSHVVGVGHTLNAAANFLMGHRVNLGSLSFVGTDGTCANVAAIYIDPVNAGTARYGIFQNGTDLNVLKGSLNLYGDLYPLLGGSGMKIGTTGGASGHKLGFWGATPIFQPVLATGAGHTVDDVITTLQSLGLVRQT